MDDAALEAVAGVTVAAGVVIFAHFPWFLMIISKSLSLSLFFGVGLSKYNFFLVKEASNWLTGSIVSL